MNFERGFPPDWFAAKAALHAAEIAHESLGPPEDCHWGLTPILPHWRGGKGDLDPCAPEVQRELGYRGVRVREVVTNERARVTSILLASTLPVVQCATARIARPSDAKMASAPAGTDPLSRPLQ